MGSFFTPLMLVTRGLIYPSRPVRVCGSAQDPRRSRLKRIVPCVGSFFTPLMLVTGGAIYPSRPIKTLLGYAGVRRTQGGAG